MDSARKASSQTIDSWLEYNICTEKDHSGQIQTLLNLAKTGHRYAISSLELMVAEGKAEAQNVAGLCHHYGYGTLKDTQRASSYYLKSAKQGNSEAFENLLTLAKENDPYAEKNAALCKEKGWGTPIDIPSALQLYLKASLELGNYLQGDIASEFELGKNTQLPEDLYKLIIKNEYRALVSLFILDQHVNSLAKDYINKIKNEEIMDQEIKTIENFLQSSARKVPERVWY